MKEARKTYIEDLKEMGYSEEYINETLKIALHIRANMNVPALARKLEVYTDRKQLCLVVNEKLNVQFQFTTLHNVSPFDVKNMLCDMLTWRNDPLQED
jgi:hypothetical protein